MSLDLLSMIEDLEEDLAAGYDQLNRLVRIKCGRTPYDDFVAQCRGHAGRVAEERERLAEPRLDPALVTAVHLRIKEKVFREVLEAPDETAGFALLADAERDVGRLYDRLALHCERLSAHYADLAGRIGELACDEREHEAMLRRRAAGHAAPPPAAEPARSGEEAPPPPDDGAAAATGTPPPNA